MNYSYKDFLKNKIVSVNESGFDVDPDDVHSFLFSWQRHVVSWACKIGKAALFEECGLGKTVQQIEWARLVSEHTGGRVIIACPLAVAHQTIREGKKVDVNIRYVRHQSEVDAINGNCKIFITNYEMLKEFDASAFQGVVLDESSILKAYTGATKRFILSMFERTPYKLACTATPAPNDHLELGNHAEFLNIMPSNEMIQRWFINDTMKAGGYRLKKHASDDFWRWVTSWAVCISTPSDIGYPDTCSDYDFNMPELIIKRHMTSVDHTRAFDNGQLLLTGALSATEMWREKKATLTQRCDATVDIVNGNDSENWIIWCETNAEADYLKQLHPDAVEVRGSQSIKLKEELLQKFTDGEAKKIITKSDIAGFGLNWQHCNNQIFVSTTYSFEKTYQALRRSWRFGQTKDVNAWMIYSETEGNIIKSLDEKQSAHREMQVAMNKAMRENGIDYSKTGKRFKMDEVNRIEKSHGSDAWTMMLGDCVTQIANIMNNSIDFSVYSPPFSNLYIYSDNIADMGNSQDDAEFMEHYKFLIAEIYRTTKPGRLTAIHCKDLPLYKNRDGAAGLRDFPGEIIRAHEELGWVYHSRVTIWKDPVIEMQRTKNHGLLHKNFCARAENCRQGMADYMIVMRKWEGVDGTESEVSVKHDLKRKEHDYKGEDKPKGAQDDRDYSIQVWQKYASPVWNDIRQTNVLNYQMARDDKDEKHICPLQLDVIERSIDLWTNEGDLVLSPFAGIGSEGYCAVKMKRRFVGIELKESYFDHAVQYLKDAEQLSKSPTLFEFAGIDI